MIKHFPSKRLVLLAIFLSLISRFGNAEPELKASGIRPFAIEFLRSRVAFSGSIDSKVSADLLASAILSARPDLQVVNTGMDFHPEVSMPNLKLLQSLVVEIALSTDEGVLEISDDSLMVGGLTDSVVTESVLRLRAEPILGKRRFREQLCLVPTEDLPEIPVLLSTGESKKVFTFDLELKLKKEVNFEPPGILLTKILRLIEGTSDSSGIFPEVAAPPVTMVEPDPAALDIPVPASEPPPLPPPPSPYEEIGPILFVRNGFLLQSGQQKVMDRVASTLQSEPWVDRPVIVRALTYQSGSEAFAGWLSKRRMEETVRQLTEAGINPEWLQPEAANTLERMDRGEVHILILKPAELDPPAVVVPPAPGL